MSNETARLTFYGASDDLVEFEGAISEEFDLPVTGKWSGLIVAPNGDQLTLTAEYGRKEWELGVLASGADGYPSWPIRFTERPDCEGDPAIEIDAPLGTVITTKENA